MYSRIDSINKNLKHETSMSFHVTTSRKFSLSAKIQNTIEKDSKKPDSWASDYKNSNFETGPMLSVTYFFRNKKSKNNEREKQGSAKSENL